MFDIVHTTTCDSRAQWLACRTEQEKIKWKRGCRCLCWRNMRLGGSSQYMLVAVPLAVGMLGWMRQTQWPLLCVEGGCSLWLCSRLPAQSPSPINSFMCFPKKQTSICAAYRKWWPRLICVCTLSQSHWKWAAVLDKHSNLFFSLSEMVLSVKRKAGHFCS